MFFCFFNPWKASMAIAHHIFVCFLNPWKAYMGRAHHTFVHFLVVVFGCFFNSFHKNIWVTIPEQGCSSCKSSATHSYKSLQHFRVSTQWHGCQCLGFLLCAQMLTHAIALRGWTNTVRESALNADSRRKNPCQTVKSNLHQYCPWLFTLMLYQLSYSAPSRFIWTSPRS